MPRYRLLHTKIVDSYDFAEMPDDFTRVFWMLLMVTVDSEGRAIDNPAWLRSKMFPLRPDVDFTIIESSLAWLANRNMIIRYVVDERKFFYIPKFKTYQRGTEKETKSVLPAPPELLQSYSEVGTEEVRVAASASASVIESVNESGAKKPNIYSVYEREIGLITPMIAEELKDAEKEYPPGWIEDAFREAANNQKRSWAYTKAILRRWKTEGRGSKRKPVSTESENPYGPAIPAVRR